MTHQNDSESPQPVAEAESLVGVAMHDLIAVGDIVENIGQAWCLCPYEWGIDDYITIQSSQGQLALCAVGRVVDGPNRGKLRYKPLTKIAIHDLSANDRTLATQPAQEDSDSK